MITLCVVVNSIKLFSILYSAQFITTHMVKKQARSSDLMEIKRQARNVSMSKNIIKILKPLTVTIATSLIALSSVNTANAFSTKCPGTAISSGSCAACHGAVSPRKSNGSCPANTSSRGRNTGTKMPATGGNTGRQKPQSTGTRRARPTGERHRRTSRKSEHRSEHRKKSRHSRRRENRNSDHERRERDDDD